jgi:competence protein ComEC
MALGILLIPAIPLLPGLAHPILWLLDKVLSLFYWLVDIFHTHMDASLYRASPSLMMVAVALFLFFLLTMAVRHKWIKTLLVLALIVITANMVTGKHFRPTDLQVFYLDVGQGDSAVVVFPGGDALLIDGGGTYYSDFPVGRRVVLPFLLQMGIGIKWVAVSHYHPDHVRGVLEIIHILRPRELWISSAANANPYYQALLAHPPSGMTVRRVQAGFSTTVAGCRIQVLWPDTFIENNHTHNNHSMVVKVSNSRHSFLFTGDVEGKAEANVVRTNCRGIRADVLKVAHHGSRTSSRPSFLHCVRPRWAIFSYGRSNRFKFPHPEVVQRLAGFKVHSLTTAMRGGISVLSANSGLVVQTSR